jgi:peroxiredoxin
MMTSLGLSMPLSALADAPIKDDAKATLNETVPDFALPDLGGKTHRISDYRGKTVVLEWFNPGCPFVVYAYEEGPLKGMATQHGDELVWLNINSGAPGNQGAGIAQNQKAKKEWGIQHPVLLDESGAVGQAFGAKTTPQLVVIDAEGTIRYNGALDNAPRGKQKAESYEAHLVNAIQALAAGQRVEPQSTKPYGCSVKYAK